VALGLLRNALRPARRAELGALRAVVEHAEGWLTHAEGMLLHELARSCRQGSIVEIGSWKGRSTIWLACGSRRGAGRPVVAVDPHTGSEEHRTATFAPATFDEFRSNLERAGVSDAVEPLVTTSVAAASAFAEPVGLVFIDGAHDYESVCDDIEAWHPKLLPGGTMAFHDVVSDWPGVWQAVHDRAIAPGRLERVRFVHSVVYGRVVEAPTRRAALAGRLALAYKRAYDRTRPLLGLVGRLLRRA
jgi:predicted O-methyltransferase YrrM